mmetsp:Transcript_2563/g.7612  ORF Transcript_2563/g.7612 Transcript_2563/m.7612 type:complete len:99 (+) Transcript_2563:79-375(+)
MRTLMTGHTHRRAGYLISRKAQEGSLYLSPPPWPGCSPASSTSVAREGERDGKGETTSAMLAMSEVAHAAATAVAAAEAAEDGGPPGLPAGREGASRS